MPTRIQLRLDSLIILYVNLSYGVGIKFRECLRSARQSIVYRERFDRTASVRPVQLCHSDQDDQYQPMSRRVLLYSELDRSSHMSTRVLLSGRYDNSKRMSARNVLSGRVGGDKAVFGRPLLPCKVMGAHVVSNRVLLFGKHRDADQVSSGLLLPRGFDCRVTVSGRVLLP